MDLSNLWQAALGEIELNLSRAAFATWFSGTTILSQEKRTIIIGVPDNFKKTWLEKKYYKIILKALRDINPKISQVQFQISKVNEKNKTTKKDKKEVKKINPKITTRSIFNGVDSETNLNARYQFENFVVGSFNELAHAACQAIINNLGTLYNPFFVYGGVGLGKTHLIQATGNIIAKKHPKKRIKYVTADKFSNQLVSALQRGTINQFKDIYRDNVDVLIIDDVQFISGREKTQIEFFHTFNALYEKNKQIIISSDRPPKAISTLEERLRSRLEGGMVADISLPDLETRIAILKKKAEQKNIIIPEEIIEYIAQSIKQNIRELEGAFNKVIASHQLNNIPLTKDFAKKTLIKSINIRQKNITPKQIIQAVANFYEVKVNDLIKKSRRKEIAWPRQIAMYLLREELNISFPTIGEKLGGRDHTTVMYAHEKISQEIQNSDSLRQEVDFIKEKIYNK